MPTFNAPSLLSLLSAYLFSDLSGPVREVLVLSNVSALMSPLRGAALGTRVVSMTTRETEVSARHPMSLVLTSPLRFWKAHHSWYHTQLLTSSPCQLYYFQQGSRVQITPQLDPITTQPFCSQQDVVNL